jgi:hypothetical protein
MRSLADRVGASAREPGRCATALEGLRSSVDELRRRLDEATRRGAGPRGARRAEARVAALESSRRKTRGRARPREAGARPQGRPSATPSPVSRGSESARRSSTATSRRSRARGGARAGREPIAGRAQGERRVTEAAGREPGTTLDGARRLGRPGPLGALRRARHARDERERIVVEANALGSAVLGEQLGASSVALVRRRLESGSADVRTGIEVAGRRSSAPPSRQLDGQRIRRTDHVALGEALGSRVGRCGARSLVSPSRTRAARPPAARGTR